MQRRQAAYRSVKMRIPLPAVILIALVMLIGAAALIGSPRAMYTRRAIEAYNASLSSWESEGPAAYTIVVASNSLAQPIGG